MTEKYVPSPEVVEQGLYVAYTALSTMAVVPIYFGSFAALKKWKVKHVEMNILDMHCIGISLKPRPGAKQT